MSLAWDISQDPVSKAKITKLAKSMQHTKSAPLWVTGTFVKDQLGFTTSTVGLGSQGENENILKHSETLLG